MRRMEDRLTARIDELEERQSERLRASAEFARLRDIFIVNVTQSPSAISMLSPGKSKKAKCLLCDRDAVGCHIIERKFLQPGTAAYRSDLLDLVFSWTHDLEHWDRGFCFHHPMNLLPLCGDGPLGAGHHRAFDSHEYLLVYNGVNRRCELYGLATRSTHVIPEQFSSQLSRRAIAFRLDRVRDSGLQLSAEVSERLETVRDLSARGSVVGADD